MAQGPKTTMSAAEAADLETHHRLLEANLTTLRINRSGPHRLPYEVHDIRQAHPIIAQFAELDDAETYLAIKEGRAGVVLVTSATIEKRNATPQKEDGDA